MDKPKNLKHVEEFDNRNFNSIIGEPGPLVFYTPNKWREITLSGQFTAKDLEWIVHKMKVRKHGK